MSFLNQALAEIKSGNLDPNMSSKPAPEKAPEANVQSEQGSSDDVAPQTEPKNVQAETQTAKEEPVKKEPRYVEKERNGKKIRIKLDENDNEESLAIKAHDYHEGMRKFQKERDDLSKWKEQQGDKLARYDELQKVLKTRGIDGIINLLAGDETAAEKYKKDAADRALKRFNATDDELAKMDYEERLVAEKRAREMAELEKQEILNSVKADKEAAARDLVKGRLETSFNKVRLEGKMDNPKRADSFNKIIWREALESIDAYAQSKGIAETDVPVAIIQEAFNKASEQFSDLVNSQVKEEVQKKLQDKKDSATKKAQLRSNTSTPKMTVEEAAAKATSSNTIGGFLREYMKATRR